MPNRIMNDTSRCVIHDTIVTLQIVASLTVIIIYDLNMFIVQAQVSHFDSLNLYTVLMHLLICFLGVAEF